MPGGDRCTDSVSSRHPGAPPTAERGTALHSVASLWPVCARNSTPEPVLLRETANPQVCAQRCARSPDTRGIQLYSILYARSIPITQVYTVPNAVPCLPNSAVLHATPRDDMADGHRTCMLTSRPGCTRHGRMVACWPVDGVGGNRNPRRSISMRQCSMVGRGCMPIPCMPADPGSAVITPHPAAHEHFEQLSAGTARGLARPASFG